VPVRIDSLVWLDRCLSIWASFRGQFFVFEGEGRPPAVVDRLWERKPFHYDNVFMGMLTLFAVQTSEGWVA